ncbi:MAG TPA: NAD-dependent deacylase [Gaiella sp.]|nr:NAD-dependent deacylase [Gaiella sp.]
MSSAEALATLILENGPAVILSGAGMSTESGIPDFRSSGGLWEQVDPYEVASIDAFRTDPLRVWGWYGPRVELLASAVPNAGHLALAELERDGRVQAVATQNIDTLHLRAGSCEVVELHGSIRRFDCLSCGAVATLGMVLTHLREDLAPTCAACDAILKPGVVMFGEQLPERAMARAEALCRGTRLLVVLGSSLEVWPAAALPRETVRAGGTLAIVNLDETPYDGDAALIVREPVAVVLEQVARILASGSGSDAPVVV